MVVLSRHQFFQEVNKIFESVFLLYAFELHEEAENLVIARKRDCELIFRLERGLYCSLGMRLSGHLARMATADPYYRYRELGISAIANCLDPEYDRSFRQTETEKDLIDILQGHKEELLKYCTDILLGDVSSWQTVVDCLNKTRARR